MSTDLARLPERARAGGRDPATVAQNEPILVHVLDASSYAALDGHLCGLFAVDIVAFNARQRDDDIRLYVHKSLYEMLQVAFDRADVPWHACVRSDRGDGALVIIPPAIPVTGLVAVPDRLRALVRRHNHVSSDAARLQLRVAMHIGPVHYDGHGFVGQDVNLLFRLLDARALKRVLSESGAEVALLASDAMYKHVILRQPALVDLALFRRLRMQVKETRTSAWAYTPGS
jgi:class 3 adenylate cyclase